MSLQPNYRNLSNLLENIVTDLRILSGDEVGNAAWQDVAGTLATNMRVYAKLLEQARAGAHIDSFPSIDEIIEGAR